jgi:hypothetical protein
MVIITASPFVDIVESKQQCLLACLCVNGVALLHVSLNQLVTPPCEEDILWPQIVVVGATEVQVFKSEEFILRCHGRWGYYGN